MIRMMIWGSARTKATQNVGRKSIGSFRVTPSLLATKNRSKKIRYENFVYSKDVAMPLMKRSIKSPVPSSQGRTHCNTREALLEKGLAGL